MESRMWPLVLQPAGSCLQQEGCWGCAGQGSQLQHSLLRVRGCSKARGATSRWGPGLSCYISLQGDQVFLPPCVSPLSLPRNWPWLSQGTGVLPRLVRASISQSLNHRMVGKGPLEVIWGNPLLNQGHLERLPISYQVQGAPWYLKF